MDWFFQRRWIFWRILNKLGCRCFHGGIGVQTQKFINIKQVLSLWSLWWWRFEWLVWWILPKVLKSQLKFLSRLHLIRFLSYWGPPPWWYRWHYSILFDGQNKFVFFLILLNQIDISLNQFILNLVLAILIRWPLLIDGLNILILQLRGNRHCLLLNLNLSSQMVLVITLFLRFGFI